MDDLIKALIIFKKYIGNSNYPTACEHDTLYVCGVERDLVSDKDVKELDRLGFFWDEEAEEFASFKYGSC